VGLLYPRFQNCDYRQRLRVCLFLHPPEPSGVFRETFIDLVVEFDDQFEAEAGRNLDSLGGDLRELFRHVVLYGGPTFHAELSSREPQGDVGAPTSIHPGFSGFVCYGLSRKTYAMLITSARK